MINIKNQETNREERFNPDGECRSVAIDFITYYFKGILLPESKVVGTKTFNDLLNLFDGEGLTYKYKMPFMSFISPESWFIVLKFFNSLAFNPDYIKTMNFLAKKGVKHCSLIKISANKMYNLLDQNWTHLVVKYWDTDLSEYRLYDPLKAVLEKERPIKIISLEEIDYSFTRSVLIWN